MSKSTLRSVGQALNWGSNIALALVLLATVLVLLAPHVTGWRYGILRSGSMGPTMPAGAAIVVAPAGVADVRPGDVITYRSADNAGLLVTHRVVALGRDQRGQRAFLTKGDANEEPDGTLVAADRLVGRVIFHLPHVGQLSQRLHTKTAFFLLIALPTVLIIAFELRELAGGVNDLRRGKKRQDGVGTTVAEET